MKKAFLLLADGTLFEGQAVGYEGSSIGEVVFNTGMAGYQEVLTDPSYYGQVVTMTYPLVGNYGINFEDYESRKSWVSGFIMREMCEYPSNWRCKHTLDEYLKMQKVVGLSGIDTRKLTRMLRNSGVMNGVIYTEGHEPDEETLARMKAYTVKDAVRAVSCTENKVYPAVGEAKYRIALFDFGVKYNIERELCRRGCEVVKVPGFTSAETVLAGGYDGVMLSNGPGDPAENVEIVENLRKLADSGIPIFGICLGHQLMSLAIGAETRKLKYGHRGVNHPVKDLDADRTYITSQNHGYAVVGETVDPAVARVRYVNLNDGTVEGVEHIGRPIFTVQYHPEVCPGPMDTSYLFDIFIQNIEKTKGGAQ
ncbi:carbamoyl phosphate synthase small subunit [Intestinibacillus massiliensis]|uniref:carbamoyl phosphate synthase small subunit n=1 Tax=Intestinibacillus massiliensis TaxID=1871029 RepID=UPI000B3508EA|nr:carbamoyl phosphate synthase small subunit [Intestinibacillus massiliensis]